MKRLAENIKCLVAPGRFIGLTFQKGIVGYTLLVTIIFTALINISCYFLNDYGTSIAETVDSAVPEFYYENGELSFNNNKKFEYGNERSYLYIDTSVKSFTNYNIFDHVDLTTINAQQAMFVSRTNILMVSQGVNMAPLTDLLGTKDFDKAALKDTLIRVAPWAYAGFSALGTIIGIFFWALIWGLLPYIINRFQMIKYSYGRIYRMTVYVMIPLRILKLLCVRFIPIANMSTGITMTFRGLIAVYLILALFLDDNLKPVRDDKPA